MQAKWRQDPGKEGRLYISQSRCRRCRGSTNERVGADHADLLRAELRKQRMQETTSGERQATGKEVEEGMLQEKKKDQASKDREQWTREGQRDETEENERMMETQRSKSRAGKCLASNRATSSDNNITRAHNNDKSLAAGEEERGRRAEKRTIKDVGSDEGPESKRAKATGAKQHGAEHVGEGLKSRSLARCMTSQEKDSKWTAPFAAAEVASTQPSQEIGSIASVYIYVGSDASLEEVVVDLRNHGPTALLMACADADLAFRAEALLSKCGLDGGRPAGRGSNRASPTRFQAQYSCVRLDRLIAAGRLGIVASVESVYACEAPLTLITEIKLNVSLCSRTSLRVAVAESIDIDGVPELAEKLCECSVRLLAGACFDDINLVLNRMRGRLACNMAAWTPSRFAQTTTAEQFYVSPHYMFVLGPVAELKVAWSDPTKLKQHTRGDGDKYTQPIALNLPSGRDPWQKLLSWVAPEVPCKISADCTEGAVVWPLVNQKVAQTMTYHTAKLCIFCGARKSRRQADKIEKRTNAMHARAQFWSTSGKPWARAFTAKQDTAKTREKCHDVRDRWWPNSHVSHGHGSW